MEIFLIKAFQFLLSLSLIVILHELGHFIPAKIFKTKVEKFYLFFDVKFSIFKKKIGDTIYGIGWLPLGGYVKIAGMIDESMDLDQMKKDPQPWEFRSKPAWQRLIIMLGGVTVNIILGFLIYMMILFIWGKDVMPYNDMPDGFNASPVAKSIGFRDGDLILEVDNKELESVVDINRYLFLRNSKRVKVKHASGKIEMINIPENFGSMLFEAGEIIPLSPRISNTVDSIVKGGPADLAGIKAGDKIIALFEDEISSRNDITIEKYSKKDSLKFTIQRNGNSIVKYVYPREDSFFGGYFKQNFKLTHVGLTFSESIVQGFSYGYWTLYEYIAQFKYIFTKKGASQLGGFGAIGSLFPSKWDWKGFWSSTALISIILAFMNILPIPALDGGHAMFLMYEIITGRKANDKVLEYAQVIGFIFLITLVIYANGNDLYRWLYT